jgi:hypothetical protein
MALGTSNVFLCLYNKRSTPSTDNNRSPPACRRCCLTIISALLIPILQMRPPGLQLGLNPHVTQSQEALLLIAFSKFNT